MYAVHWLQIMISLLLHKITYLLIFNSPRLTMQAILSETVPYVEIKMNNANWLLLA